MKTSTGWIIGVIMLLIFGAAVGVLAHFAQPYQTTIDSGPSKEARSNHYLAAEKYLQGRGLSVNHDIKLKNLHNVAGQPQTLLLLASRKKMTPADVTRLLAWTKAGNRLLVVAEEKWNEKTKRSGDLLLDRMHIEQYLTSELKDDDSAGQPEKSANDAYPGLTKIYLENESAPAYANFDTRFHLFDPDDQATAWADSANATHMLEIPYGDGTLIAVTDSELWTNQQIGRYDNAWLLWYLTQDTHVSMFMEVEHESLFQQLGKNFPQALLALAVLIALGIWAAAVRQGPLIASAPKGSRQWQEHLRATADFVLRRHGHHRLLQALQQDILRQARRRYPGFDRLIVTDQWQVLSRLTRQPTSVISQALRPRPKQRISSADFSRQVAHLQTLRNAL